MVMRLDVMHELAQGPAFDGIPRASRPMVYFTQGTESLIGAITPDFDAAYDLLRPSVGPEALGAMAIRVVPQTSRLTGALGELYDEPVVLEGRVHFPVFDVAVNVRRPRIGLMNNTARHELRHVVQPVNTVLYYNETAVFITRLSLLGLAAVALAETGSGNPAVPLMAAPLACLSSTANAEALLSLITPQEVDARWFARRHPKYNLFVSRDS